MAQRKTKSGTQIMMEYNLRKLSKKGGFMADLKTQIESAKKIRERKGCKYSSCHDCPASVGNSGSDCRDKFGGQDIRNFDNKALAWFQNWLKENDVERDCETCRFFWENTKSGKSECPEGLPACGERNNLYKWQPIPKELKDGMDFAAWVPKETPLKPPYVITDIPEDEEIFIRVCEKAGKEWERLKVPHVIQFAECKGAFPIKLYVRSRLTFSDNDYITSNEPKTHIHYKDFLKIKQEDLKMKQVVLGTPNKEIYVDVKWFKDNEDCGAGEEWFVENYGKDAKVLFSKAGDLLFNQGRSDGLKFMSDHEPQQQLTDDYVYIGDVDKDKIYILVGEHNLYKLQNVQDNKWSFCELNNSYSIAYGYSYGMEKEITVAISNHKKVYEFKTFKDFTKAHQEGKI
jgi:hypothetical protein